MEPTNADATHTMQMYTQCRCVHVCTRDTPHTHNTPRTCTPHNADALMPHTQCKCTHNVDVCTCAHVIRHSLTSTPCTQGRCTPCCTCADATHTMHMYTQCRCVDVSTCAHVARHTHTSTPRTQCRCTPCTQCRFIHLCTRDTSHTQKLLYRLFHWALLQKRPIRS